MQPQGGRGLTAVMTMGVALTLAGCGEAYDPFEASSGESASDYRTEPDLSAPEVEVTTQGAERPWSDDELVLLAPKDGEAIDSLVMVDAEGEPVGIHDGRSYDFKVQECEGEPVPTYWRGENLGLGYGAGEFVLLDSGYEEVATVTTHGTQRADFHNMTLTDDGTALLVSYPEVERDLSSIGGPERGHVLDGVVQEVDVATREVLFEWSALDHIPLTDTRIDIQPAEGQDGGEDTRLDYVHVNAVSEDGDKALLISARNSQAVYRVDRETGDVDWTLGGSSSDFAMEGGASFAWQHDVQRQDDGTITLFDNENAPATDDQSRGLRLELDMSARIAGDDADSAEEVATVARKGFETSAEVPDAAYVAVEALDAGGQVLATAES